VSYSLRSQGWLFSRTNAAAACILLVVLAGPSPLDEAHVHLLIDTAVPTAQVCTNLSQDGSAQMGPDEAGTAGNQDFHE
jgi:hypothetical protein